MREIKITVLIHPKLEIVAACPVCQREIGRIDYSGYADYSRQLKKLKTQITECPHCGAVFKETSKKADIPWERTSSGDYIAKAQNGDFLVWKWGYGYKWRYIAYGAQTPEQINFERTRAAAQRACERHREWKL